jgi:ABC-type uncharacterized transport system permease subunit
MYPIVLFGIITLVIFIILVAANPADMNNKHVFISLVLGFILTFLILYQRAIDTNDAKKKQDLNQIFWMFRDV